MWKENTLSLITSQSFLKNNIVLAAAVDDVSDCSFLFLLQIPPLLFFLPFLTLFNKYGSTVGEKKKKKKKMSKPEDNLLPFSLDSNRNTDI